MTTTADRDESNRRLRNVFTAPDEDARRDAAAALTEFDWKRLADVAADAFRFEIADRPHGPLIYAEIIASNDRIDAYRAAVAALTGEDWRRLETARNGP